MRSVHPSSRAAPGRTDSPFPHYRSRHATPFHSLLANPQYPAHAQFVSFFSLHLTLFLIFRHQPQRHHATHRPSNLFERIALSILSLICAAAVAASRVYLNYHTPRQVLVGVGAGSGFAIVWFGFTTYLRWSGWLEWMLELDVLRKLRVRDLLLQEDLQDAGWGRWEARRESRRRGAAAAAAVANGGGGSKLKAR